MQLIKRAPSNWTASCTVLRCLRGIDAMLARRSVITRAPALLGEGINLGWHQCWIPALVSLGSGSLWQGKFIIEDKGPPPWLQAILHPDSPICNTATASLDHSHYLFRSDCKENRVNSKFANTALQTLFHVMDSGSCGGNSIRKGLVLKMCHCGCQRLLGRDWCLWLAFSTADPRSDYHLISIKRLRHTHNPHEQLCSPKARLKV